jgi:hypothetical protein
MDKETWTKRHGQGDRDKEKGTWRKGHGDKDMETGTWRHGHGDRYMASWNFKKSSGKPKPRRFSLIRLLFAHRAKEVCHLSVCLRRNNVSYPFTDGLNGLAHLCRLLRCWYGTFPLICFRSEDRLSSSLLERQITTLKQSKLALQQTTFREL